MALIGTININMQASIAGLKKGLDGARGMLASFQSSASKLGGLASGFTGGALQPLIGPLDQAGRGISRER